MDFNNQSESKLKAFLDNSPAIIYIKDLEGRYQWINKEFENILQTSQAQIFGKTDYDFLPAEVADQLQANDQRAILQGVPINLDESVILPDGNIHSYIATKFPLLDDQGNAYATGGISFDISDRKRDEDILRYYERIVSATTDCVALIDTNYIYKLINQSYIDLHGKAYAEILGHSVCDLLGVEIFAAIKVLFDRCLEGKIQKYEGWINYAKSGLMYVTATYSPFIDSDDTISGIVINVRDISDRKRIEEKLRQSEEKFRKSFESVDKVY
jgi:PAS domain S-box-containing protein